MPENPTMEEPKEKPEAPQADIDQEATALITELKKLGVEKPEQVQGMFNASQQTGKAWNEVGELRKQVAALQQTLQEVNRPKALNREPTYEDMQGGQAIDLGALIDQKIAPLTKYVERIQQYERFTTEVQNQLNEVQADSDYPAVASIWEQHLSSPATKQRITQGETSIQREYDRTVKAYYKAFAQRAGNVIEKVQGSRKATPHIEGADTRSVQLPGAVEEKKKTLTEIEKKRSAGAISSDQALDQLVQQIFTPEMFGIK
jgi:hypothetical protein